MFPTNNEIKKEFAPNIENVTLCVWCGIPLGSANHVSQSVCIRCYNLLTGAKLSDEEIFGSRDRKITSSLPRKNAEDEK